MKKYEIKEVDPQTLILGDSIRTDDGDLTELITSIKEHGVLSPIEVDKNGVVITGRRRLQAAKKARVLFVPVRVLDIDSEAGRIVRQLIENVQRLELPPMDRAKAFARLHNITGWNKAEIARHVGVQVVAVQRLMPLVNEPEYVQEAIESGAVGYRLINEANAFPAAVRDKVKERLVADKFATRDALAMLNQAVKAEPERAEELIEENNYRIVKPPVDENAEASQTLFNAALRINQTLPYIEYDRANYSAQIELKRLYAKLSEWLGVNKYVGREAVEYLDVESDKPARRER